MSVLTKRFNTAELLILAGALAILGGQVLFGWLAYDYFMGDASVLLSTLLVLAIAFQRMGMADLGTRLTIALALLAFTQGVIALDDLVLDVRNAFAGANAVELLGRLAYYGGSVLIVVGGYMLWRPSSRADTRQ